MDVAIADGRFKTLVSAVNEAKLVDDLSGKGPLTLFAPTDDAFQISSPDELDKLLKNKDLRKILLRHVAAEKYNSAGIPAGETPITTLAKEEIKVTKKDEKLTITYKNVNANVIQADVEASNGVIHIIDAVLLGKF